MDLKVMIIDTVKSLLGLESEKVKISAGMCRRAAFFLMDNGLFLTEGCSEEEAGRLMEDVPLDLQKRLEVYLEHRNDSEEEKNAFLRKEMEKQTPVTASRLDLFFRDKDSEKDGRVVYSLLDYMAAFLRKEVISMDDKEIREFTEAMLERTRCDCTRCFADFALWQKETFRDALYCVDLEVGSRGARAATLPYSLEQISSLHYFVFNEEYLAEHNVYPKACKDRQLAHCMTYFSVHLVSALRDTDLIRFPHPRILGSAEEVLARISDGSFTDEEARQVVRSMMEELDHIPLVPNKTSHYHNIPTLYFRIPQNLEVHFGTLFAIDECFCLLDDDTRAPLFQPIKRISTIRKVMGEEAAAVFEGNDACPTAFSKTFMQLLGIMGSRAGELNGPANALFCLGLAERARSHSGGYAKFSSSTFIYLKDCSLGTLTPEMVVAECFDRGILSCHLGQFLSLLTNRDYEKLDFTGQTMLVQSLGMTSLEAEKAMEAYNKAMAGASEMFAELLSHLDPKERYKEVRRALENLSMRMAPGKDMGALCFVSALEQPCLHPDYQSCLACPYRIDTRATLYYAVRELRRCKLMKKRSRTEGEWMKYDLLIKDYIIPLISEASMAAYELFGEEAGKAVDGIIYDAMNEDDSTIHEQEEGTEE